MITAARLLPTPWMSASGLAVLGEQVGDLAVERGDPVVEVVDVAGELADAARRGALSEAVAEIDALEAAQHALAVAAQHTGLGDRVVLGPVGAQSLDRLRAVTDEAAALQLEHSERANELGLLRGAEIALDR